MKKQLLALILIAGTPLVAKTIAEKKASVMEQDTDLPGEMRHDLAQANQQVDALQLQLQQLYQEVQRLYDQGASLDMYQELLGSINALKQDIHATQEAWRKRSKQVGAQGGYALWHQPEITVGQLVIDYGSQDYVYLLTPEVAQLKINISSNLPIPAASWGEMLELVLTQNGVGIRQLNPYLRQLYLAKNDRSHLQLITNKRSDLVLLPTKARAAFVLSPEPTDAQRIWSFLEKFSNPNSVAMQMVGRDIFIVAPTDEIQDLLKLYDFVSINRGDKEYKIVPLRRVDAEEMGKILSAIFDQFSVAPAPVMTKDKQHKPPEASGLTGLRVITLAHVAQAVFLVGTQEEIKKAEEIIREVESQVGESKQKVIYWYTVRHSDPEELAGVLAKIYPLMVKSGGQKEPGQECPLQDIEGALSELKAQEVEMTGLKQPFPPRNIFDYGYYLDDSYVVDDGTSSMPAKDPNRHRNNFIVDPKSNSIVMVVEGFLLPQMKDLMKKLDVPKKMVQLEVLLFEKRLRRQTDFGLNLLKIGTLASDTHTSSAVWNDSIANRGVFQYLLSREKGNGGLPAFDLIYRFLMTQDDITINSTPSVVTLNQTTAKINVEEEISVNTGIFEIPTEGAVALKDAFARARYGIKIEITPTVHMPDEDDINGDDTAYVTLDTNVIFETIQKSFHPQRPDVVRRVIENQVRIPDGQTVILGGLRRKVTEDRKEMIPFVGELPGIGKLFSITDMDDHSTEMYIFITPTIIVHPQEDLIRVRTRELCRRPGDIPCFLVHLVRARECQKNQIMSQTMDMLFGRVPDRIEIPLGEYDGRCGCR